MYIANLPALEYKLATKYGTARAATILFEHYGVSTIRAKVAHEWNNVNAQLTTMRLYYKDLMAKYSTLDKRTKAAKSIEIEIANLVYRGKGIALKLSCITKEVA